MPHPVGAALGDPSPPRPLSLPAPARSAVRVPEQREAGKRGREAAFSTRAGQPASLAGGRGPRSHPRPRPRRTQELRGRDVTRDPLSVFGAPKFGGDAVTSGCHLSAANTSLPASPLSRSSWGQEATGMGGKSIVHRGFDSLMAF